MTPPEPMAAEPLLATRAEQAAKWSALTTLARFGLQLGAQVALARVLGPSHYGVYGLGLAVLTFATFLAGNGFSYSLMLRDRIDERDIRFAFTWQLLAGAAGAALMALGAPALARFFATPALEPTLRWLALACLLTAASGTAQCLMQRALAFRALGLVQLAAYALGYLALGLPLALAGWQAQALAIACAAQAAATLVLAWRCQPHALRPLLRHDGGAQALATGRTVFLTNLVNWLLANLDRLAAGRWLSAQAVGLYTVAWNFAQVPVTLIVGALQPAFLASAARLEGDRASLARAWHLVLASVLVLLPPVAVALALLSQDLVRFLYGPDWMPAAWVLALMFLCLPAWAAWGLSTPVLWNTGRSQQEARLQWPLLVLALPAWAWAAPQGLRALAAVSAVLVHARAARVVAAGLRALDLRASLLLPLLARGLMLAVACAAAVEGARLAVASSELALPVAWQAGASLLAGGASALLTGLVLAWAAPSLLGPQARLALSRVLPFVRATEAEATANPWASGQGSAP